MFFGGLVLRGGPNLFEETDLFLGGNTLMANKYVITNEQLSKRKNILFLISRS